MKAISFKLIFPSFRIDSSKDHHVLAFDLTSMQDATENCHYPNLVGERLRLELNFAYPLEHVTELIVLGERRSSVAIEKFGVVGKKSTMDNVSIQQIFNRNPLLTYQYRGSSPSEFVPTLDNTTFAIIITQPSFMQGELWRMIARSLQIL